MATVLIRTSLIESIHPTTCSFEKMSIIVLHLFSSSICTLLQVKSVSQHDVLYQCERAHLVGRVALPSPKLPPKL